VQRDLLDYFGGLVDLSVATANAYGAWRALADKLDALDASDSDRDAKLDLLRFQIGELEALDLQAGEFDALMDERTRLQNSGRLAEGASSALHRIYDADDGNAHALVSAAGRDIEALATLDDELEPVASLLSEAGIQLAECADHLRRYGDALESDPARQNDVEERLDAITNIARKHRREPEEIDELLHSLRQERDELANAEERGDALRASADAARDSYGQLAAQLSDGRRKAAARFSAAVTEAMSDLGMPGGVFDVRITADETGVPRASGADDIDFLISANPGQAPQPLSKIASGGELSRMSLAIQVIASDGSRIPTMVFDEVDSGVGGRVAEIVGKRLRDLGETRQVFCVTHLPQVASLGDHHFRIIKMSDGKSTRTSITALNEDERVEEIARMLGGVEITQRTRDHAAEMLSSGGGRSVADQRG
jgi:DNA repair protein RecN (Recombination protein N)